MNTQPTHLLVPIEWINNQFEYSEPLHKNSPNYWQGFDDALNQVYELKHIANPSEQTKRIAELEAFVKNVAELHPDSNPINIIIKAQLLQSK